MCPGRILALSSMFTTQSSGLFLLGRGSRFTTLGGFLFLLDLLDLLDHDLDDLDLGQSIRTTAVRPTFVVFQGLDPLAAREHVAGALQGVFPAKAFVNG